MNYAGLGTRFFALVIDYIILVIIGGLVSQIVDSEILGIGVGFLVGVLYNWYFWTRNNGQTPGKQVMGIRVVKADGSKINDLEAVIRYIGYHINTFLLLLGWLWAIPDGKNQGLHDKLVGTVVVKA
jgi:uncharacterized RDD family membrane protein YckC